REFADKRESDRISVVTFAGEAFTQCPLTSDKRVVDAVLENLQPGILEDGTAIGMGLATGVNRLKESKVKSKIIILLTDGVNNAGYIEPMTAAKLAADMGIKIYVIGVGTQGQALAPISRTNDGQFIFGYTQVEIDENLMTEIADLTKGQYFRATDKNSLQGIYNRINELEKTKIDKTVLKKNVDYFHVFLYAGLLLILIEIFLKNTWLRTPVLVE
ncbi:MAG TPA: VWA domain-containing protein, partial [Saprospiraceae bacterium]|nr:VWA domain-containing protein [Saprospiraceae bacterium]